MPESQGSARTTISIPAGLKREMEAVKVSVNWSSVAADAFRAKLLELKAKQKGANKKDVIARLQARAELEGNEDRQAGKEAGAAWASDTAGPKELRRMEEHADELFEGEPDAFGYAGVLHSAIHGKGVGDRRELMEFWEEILQPGHGDRIHDKDFARGFVEGALEVWVEAKVHL